MAKGGQERGDGEKKVRHKQCLAPRGSSGERNLTSLPTSLSVSVAVTVLLRNGSG